MHYDCVENYGNVLKLFPMEVLILLTQLLSTSVKAPKESPGEGFKMF